MNHRFRSWERQKTEHLPAYSRPLGKDLHRSNVTLHHFDVVVKAPSRLSDPFSAQRATSRGTTRAAASSGVMNAVGIGDRMVGIWVLTIPRCRGAAIFMAFVSSFLDAIPKGA